MRQLQRVEEVQNPHPLLLSLSQSEQTFLKQLFDRRADWLPASETGRNFDRCFALLFSINQTPPHTEFAKIRHRHRLDPKMAATLQRNLAFGFPYGTIPPMTIDELVKNTGPSAHSLMSAGRWRIKTSVLLPDDESHRRTGKLSDEILTSMNLQQDSKIQKFTQENVEDEFADVLGADFAGY